jgi:hypothetical protein
MCIILILYPLVVSLYFAFMTSFEASCNKKKVACMNYIKITNIQRHMLGSYFEGMMLSCYGSYDVVNGAYKYIHCDLIDMARFLTRSHYEFNP